MAIGDYSATDADNTIVPGTPPIELGEGIGGGPTGHQTLRLSIQRIMADLKTLDGTLGGGVDTLARANHTGTQTASTVSDFSAAADARITAAIGVSAQAYDADTAKTDVAQTFTAFQAGTNEAMTDGATITPTGTKHYHSVTLGGNRTLANPTTITAGGTYVFKIAQDGTGSRTLSWGAAYDWAGGTAPTLTTTASGVDVFSGVSVDGTTIQMVTVGQAFS